jgi:hypothetical protein
MKLLKYYILSLLLLSLSGCFGSDDEEVVSEDCEVTASCIPAQETSTLAGTVAIGVALAGADITVIDKDGNELLVAAVTDANGNYTIDFIGPIPAPVQIVVKTADGNELSAIVDDPEATVANVNPITSYVAKTILETGTLATVTTGDVATVGQETVESLFGEGAQFDAFATETFVAKSSSDDFSTQVSAADVLLDSLADAAATTDVETLIAQTAASDSSLMDSTDFIISVATNLALVEGATIDIAEVFDVTESSSEVQEQLADVVTFQAVAEEIITTVAENPDLDTEEATATAIGLIDVVAEVSVEDGILQTDSIDLVSENVVENLLDDIVKVVTSEEAKDLSSEELIAAVENTTEQIVDIIVNDGVDLSTSSPDLTTIEDSLAGVVIIIENTKDWDNAKWDKLVWQ